MNIYQKLQKARVELQKMPLKKTGENKFVGYKYFELGDFIPHVNILFEQLGLCGTISLNKEMATLLIIDTEVTQGNAAMGISFTVPMSSAALKGAHEVQNEGAVISYLRRYLWILAMELTENDILDATQGKPDNGDKPSSTGKVSALKDKLKGDTPPPAAPIDADRERKKSIYEMLKTEGFTLDKIELEVEPRKLKEITADEFQAIANRLLDKSIVN